MTKKAPKFIQIACCTDKSRSDVQVYALDGDGVVWHLNLKGWVRETDIDASDLY